MDFQSSSAILKLNFSQMNVSVDFGDQGEKVTTLESCHREIGYVIIKTLLSTLATRLKNRGTHTTDLSVYWYFLSVYIKLALQNMQL
jgi:hypothetical protein